MPIRVVTRRSALRTLGASAFLAFGAVPRGLAGGSPHIREIRVDVEPLRASAGDPTAEWVEQTLPGALTKALAPLLASTDRDGGMLIARIKAVYLGSAGGSGMGSAQDSIEGDLIVKAPRASAATRPVRATNKYDPSAADQALVEEAYHGRVVALAQAFAGWAPRELGL